MNVKLSWNMPDPEELAEKLIREHLEKALKSGGVRGAKVKLVKSREGKQEWTVSCPDDQREKAEKIIAQALK